MTFFIAWAVFPVVLGLLCLGCGLLLQHVSAVQLPAALLLPAGFAVVSVATQFPHLSDSTASLGTPLAVALSLIGFGLQFRLRKPRVDRWLVATGAGVFAVFAAPVFLSFRVTFAGFMKLDDIANYMAMVDRGMRHGYDVTGLPLATYETYLHLVYVFGYPLGSVLPLGVGSALVGQNVTWVWQPYVTFLALMIGLTLYQLAGSLVASRRLRALVAFIGAQSAITYGYAQWGGVKELSTAFLVIMLVALIPPFVRQDTLRGVLPLAVVSADVLSVLSVGGGAWLFVPLGGALALTYVASGIGRAIKASVAFLVSVSVLAIPAFAAGPQLLDHSTAFTSSKETANLRGGGLSWLQIFGIWPNGDFRTKPGDLTLTHVLIALVAVAGVGGLWVAWRRRAWDFLLATGTITFACYLYLSKGSPWIAGKTLASASPIVLGLAVAGVAVLFESGRRAVAGAIACVIAAGVLWSNALQYQGVYIAPTTSFQELAAIGKQYSGQGPTLMTSFSIYGDRHFLRSLAAEGAGELRYHQIFLRNGGIAATGESPDIDEIRLDQILYYKTLVVPTSGVASRPPSVYTLVRSGRFFQVWQRSAGAAATILEHISFGSRYQPAAVPACSTVLKAASVARQAGDVLATVIRPPAIVIQPDGTVAAPTVFGRYGQDPSAVTLTKATTFQLAFTTPAAGVYRVWVAGSFRAGLQATIDGVAAGSERDQLQWPGTFYPFGTVSLGAGHHVLRFHYTGPDWYPGSKGATFGVGPFAVALGDEDRPVTYVQPANAHSLCGKSLDWLEVVKP